jgi:hypothetical protein
MNPLSVEIVMVPAAGSLRTAAVSRKCSMGRDSSGGSFASAVETANPQTMDESNAQMRTTRFSRSYRNLCKVPVDRLAKADMVESQQRHGKPSSVIIPPGFAFQKKFSAETARP